MSGTLVIVPCGRSKIWDKQPEATNVLAQDAYVGSPFKVNKAYAQRFGTHWVILSALHGFIDPDFHLPGPYNVTFKRKKSGPITFEKLREQVLGQRLDQFEVVIGLGGKEYRRAVEEAYRDAAVRLIFPFSGLPVGKAMQAINRAIDSNLSHPLSRTPDERFGRSGVRKSS